MIRRGHSRPRRMYVYVYMRKCRDIQFSLIPIFPLNIKRVHNLHKNALNDKSEKGREGRKRKGSIKTASEFMGYSIASWTSAILR